MSDGHTRLAIYYEHPDWFRPLFDELGGRGIPLTRLHAASHTYDPGVAEPGWDVVFNRMSPSAYTRGLGRSIFYTSQYLYRLERAGVRVINGLNAWQTEISKARQLSLLESLGLPYPAARVISDPSAAPEAASGLRFPVVVKPNVGGSGAGIVRFDTPRALAEAARSGSLDLGLDHTGLVQEFIPGRGGRIVRVEVLGGTFLYAIRVYSSGETFNLCPADVCQGLDGAQLARAACPADAPRNQLRVEGYTPPDHQIRAVERIMAASGIEVGGVEYLIDDRDGKLYYYDINALSNFVADPERVVGFDPFARLADWLERELADARQRAGGNGAAKHGVRHGATSSPPAPAPTVRPDAAPTAQSFAGRS